jgi:hypothetical protein
MELVDLVHAILRGDLLAARQWVSDAQHAAFAWSVVRCPNGLSSRELAVAAAVTEMLAERDGQRPPAWTRSIGAELETIILDPGLETMPRSFAHAKLAGPEPLRRRNLVALPDFLRVA